MNYTSGYQEVGLGNSSSGIMYAKMTCAKVCGKMCLKYLWRSKDWRFDVPFKAAWPMFDKFIFLWVVLWYPINRSLEL